MSFVSDLKIALLKENDRKMIRSLQSQKKEIIGYPYMKILRKSTMTKSKTI